MQTTDTICHETRAGLLSLCKVISSGDHGDECVRFFGMHGVGDIRIRIRIRSGLGLGAR